MVAFLFSLLLGENLPVGQTGFTPNLIRGAQEGELVVAATSHTFNQSPPYKVGFFFRRLSKELDVKLLILGNYLATAIFLV